MEWTANTTASFAYQADIASETQTWPFLFKKKARLTQESREETDHKIIVVAFDVTKTCQVDARSNTPHLTVV